MRSPRSIWIARLIITGFAPYGSLERVVLQRGTRCALTVRRLATPFRGVNSSSAIDRNRT
jgi:hypothetical protein